MDIEALVKRITTEVLGEVSATGAFSPLMSQAGVDRSPPPGRTSTLPVYSSSAGETSVCQALVSGECAGVGCCAQHMPNQVRAVLGCGADRVGNTLGGRVDHDLARMIDHTLLKPEATREEVLALCYEARQYQFASVCINPSWVKLAAEVLAGSGVKVCTVVGFPLGATTTLTKVVETRDAVAAGADEIDMVINLGALKNGQDEGVFSEIQQVVQAAQGRITKSILETALLSDAEVVKACELAKRAGVDFVKTSTGFGPGGATTHHVSLMRQSVGPHLGVKASGGIRDQDTARQMVLAGATRIGASASVKIVRGEQGGGRY